MSLSSFLLRKTMDEKQKSKNRSLRESAEGYLLVLAFTGGLLVIALFSLLFINIRENSFFMVAATIFLIAMLFQAVSLGMKGIQMGYKLLLKPLRARRDAQRPIQLSIFSPRVPITYKLGDDGEIIEMGDAEKSKRGGDSTGE
jgi:hypothetical protein